MTARVPRAFLAVLCALPVWAGGLALLAPPALAATVVACGTEAEPTPLEPNVVVRSVPPSGAVRECRFLLDLPRGRDFLDVQVGAFAGQNNDLEVWTGGERACFTATASRNDTCSFADPPGGAWLVVVEKPAGDRSSFSLVARVSGAHAADCGTHEDPLPLETLDAVASRTPAGGATSCWYRLRLSEVHDVLTFRVETAPGRSLHVWQEGVDASVCDESGAGVVGCALADPDRVGYLVRVWNDAPSTASFRLRVEASGLHAGACGSRLAPFELTLGVPVRAAPPRGGATSCYYKFTVPAGRDAFHLDLTGASGADRDIATPPWNRPVGGVPTIPGFACDRVVRTAANETCSMAEPDGGSRVFRVHNAAGTTHAFQLVARVTGPHVDPCGSRLDPHALGFGAWVSVKPPEGAGSRCHLLLDVPAGRDWLHLEMRNPSGADRDIAVAGCPLDGDGNETCMLKATPGARTVRIDNPGGATASLAFRARLSGEHVGACGSDAAPHPAVLDATYRAAPPSGGPTRCYLAVDVPAGLAAVRFSMTNQEGVYRTLEVKGPEGGLCASVADAPTIGCTVDAPAAGAWVAEVQNRAETTHAFTFRAFVPG